ncbi:RteC domain-containing protein [Dysgonomonas sp. ZJ709]|uniref:RteC domain-containing protein n=1 Tax=Dysgonomonas sp. ZJ709 TaxID=2709797 RepID=UPI002105806D|nr:RteC domain-containing protein [Dysgonomonas sp. ZJ709]
MLLETRFSHPERFIKEQTFKSDLYIIPKSDDGLGIISFVELVVALFLLGGIYMKGGRKATLIEIARAFEQMFNFKFGDIYKKQVKLFDRKGYNLTKLLDSLRNLLNKESRKRNNEK